METNHIQQNPKPQCTKSLPAQGFDCGYMVSTFCYGPGDRRDTQGSLSHVGGLWLPHNSFTCYNRALGGHSEGADEWILTSLWLSW